MDKTMERVPLNVRIDRDLREQLQNLAHDQNRTLSNLVETELKRVVAESAQTDAGKPPIRLA